MMKKLSIFILLLSTSVICWPVSFNSNGTSLTGQFRVNLQTLANFDIAFTAANGPVLVCFQTYSDLPATYSASSCQHFWQFNQSTSFSVALRDMDYWFGILSTQDGPLQLSSASPSCPPDTVWDDTTCRPVDGALSLNTPTNVTLHASGMCYYTIDLLSTWPLVYQDLQVSVVAPPQQPNIANKPGHRKPKKGKNDTPAQAIDVNAMIRWMATPSEDNFDAEGISLIVQSPAPGRWIVLIESDEEAVNQTVTITVTSRICPAQTAGPNCSTALVRANNGDTYLGQTVNPGEYKYYQWNEADQPVWVVVDSTPDHRAAMTLLRNDQAPIIGSTDLRDCNQANCAYANIIHLQNTTNNRWIIAVTPTGNVSATYHISFGSNCIANCTNATQGTCGTGVYFGVCLCKHGWVGETCSEVAPFDKAYIVLLIIGGIIVLTGAISLISSCATKPKSPDYQQL